MLTYGRMPTLADFRAAYNSSGTRAEDGFSFTWRGSDAECASSYGLATHGNLDVDDLYDYIDVLRMGFTEDGDEKAGDLASAMLDSLGFEWV